MNVLLRVCVLVSFCVCVCVILSVSVCVNLRMGVYHSVYESVCEYVSFCVRVFVFVIRRECYCMLVCVGGVSMIDKKILYDNMCHFSRQKEPACELHRFIF